VTNGRPNLIDFGPGVVRRASAANRAGVDALEPPLLSRAFATHLHSDHTAGLADLILSPWVLGRKEPLELYGPPGVGSLARHTLAAHQPDIEGRIEGLEPANDQGWKVLSRETEAGVVLREPGLTVEAIEVSHGPFRAFGYKFQTADRTIAVSGDTTPCEALVHAAEGCELLIHEVYSCDGYAGLSQEWRRYHAAMHTSSRQLAEIAGRVKPELLVLYHQLLWGVTEEELLAEIRQGYDGQIAFGRDLEVY